MKKISLADVVISSYMPGSLGKITEIHARYYSTHWNFGLFFEAQVARELSNLLTHDKWHRNGFWVALFRNEIIGSIAIDGNQADNALARLRFFIVIPEFESHGVGNLLMAKAINFCREKGFKKVFLTTFQGLEAARLLYEEWGFKLAEEKEDTTWGKLVKEQLFELVL